MIQNFLGTGVAPTNSGPEDSVGVEDDLSALRGATEEEREERREVRKRQISRLFDGLLGGGGGLGGGLLGGGGGSNASGEKNEFTAESMVADTAGTGAESGLPTCSDDGEISLVMRQV